MGKGLVDRVFYVYPSLLQGPQAGGLGICPEMGSGSGSPRHVFFSTIAALSSGAELWCMPTLSLLPCLPGFNRVFLFWCLATPGSVEPGAPSDFVLKILLLPLVSWVMFVTASGGQFVYHTGSSLRLRTQASSAPPVSHLLSK